eukprot:1826637-Amphidinium_carterae.1
MDFGYNDHGQPLEPNAQQALIDADVPDAKSRSAANLDFGAISGKRCLPVVRWRPAKRECTVTVEDEPKEVSFLSRGVPLVPRVKVSPSSSK